MDKHKVDTCALLSLDDVNGAPIQPIYQNSLFLQTRNNINHYFYTRYDNPTTHFTEQVIASLECGERAVCFSSGMAAVTSSILSCVETGQHIIAMENIYGGTKGFISSYLKRFGISVTFVGGTDIAAFERAIRPETSLIYLESPSYLYYEIIDLRRISEIARKRGIRTIIDNTLSTPLFQNPLLMGIDIVVHSMTKYINGHSDLVAGVAVGSESLMQHLLQQERMLLGAVMDPHQAWLVTRGIRTLPARMERHEKNAMKISNYLAGNKKVKKVYYPGLETHPNHELAKSQMQGFSGLISFLLELPDGGDNDFMNRLKHLHTGPSWGGFESLIIQFGHDANEQAGEEGMACHLFRLSVGLEDSDTIIEDLEQAING